MNIESITYSQEKLTVVARFVIGQSEPDESGVTTPIYGDPETRDYFDADTYLADFPERISDVKAMRWGDTSWPDSEPLSPEQPQVQLVEATQ